MKLAQRIKQLRVSQGLLQRQLSAELEIDTPMFSKIERGERRAKREQVQIIAETLKVNTDELLALWLTDKVLDIVSNENMAKEALSLAIKEIKNQEI